MNWLKPEKSNQSLKDLHTELSEQLENSVTNDIGNREKAKKWISTFNKSLNGIPNELLNESIVAGNWKTILDVILNISYLENAPK